MYPQSFELCTTRYDYIGLMMTTLPEVREAFTKNKLRIVTENPGGFTKSQVENALGQHFAVHDAKGSSLVIECIQGNAVLRDNPVGVLTNLPSFTWHLTNPGLYAHLSNVDTHGPIYFGVGGCPRLS